MRKKPIRTMEEFSALIGLSRPTVSKYFADPTSVRKTTREKIEAATKQSGFQPNFLAVNLNRRRSNIIGVVIPNVVDPFYAALTRRIEEIAHDAGYLALVFSSDGRADLEEKAIRNFKAMKVAGAIVAPLGDGQQSQALKDLATVVPLVFVDAPLQGASAFVGTDNAQSVGLIVDYLCRSGEPPCYFGMPHVNNNTAARKKAYADTIERLKFQAQYVAVRDVHTWDFEDYGYSETLRIIRQHGAFPTRTVFCANDRIAFGVISAAFELSIKVGHSAGCELRVAGHDDHPLSRYACPPITTVRQNYDAMGMDAITLLLSRVDDQDGHRQIVSTLLKADLILRASA